MPVFLDFSSSLAATHLHDRVCISGIGPEAMRDFMKQVLRADAMGRNSTLFVSLLRRM